MKQNNSNFTAHSECIIIISGKRAIPKDSCGFMQVLSDENCLAILESYESWTSYDYPKDHNIIMNNFADPYEWQ